MFSFVTGAIREGDLAYLVMISDEAAEKKMAASNIVQWEPEGWGNGGDTTWRTVGAAVARYPLEQLIVVGEFGNVLLLGNGDRHEEIIKTKDSDPTNRGPLCGVRNIGNEVFVVGMNRQVYRRTGVDAWESFDKGIDRATNTEEVFGFQAVDGFDENALYAVGWEGEIWRCTHGIWQQENSVVKNVLVDVCCAGNGFVYASGRNGILIRGKEGHWEVLPQPNFTEDIWSLAWFDNKLYAASLENVFVLHDDNTLSAVDMGEDRAATCYKLVTGASLMWSIGEKDVMCFDGARWTRID